MSLSPSSARSCLHVEPLRAVVGGNGGTLDIWIAEGPPVPSLVITFVETAVVDPTTGTATLSGTFTCEHASYIDIGITLTQATGRGVDGHTNFYPDPDACDGAPHPWSVELPATNGRFSARKSTVVASSFFCSFRQCIERSTEQDLRLRPWKR